MPSARASAAPGPSGAPSCTRRSAGSRRRRPAPESGAGPSTPRRRSNARSGTTGPRARRPAGAGRPAPQRLRVYAERLPAVEINNAFYRLPKASVLESWAEQVPSAFRFVLKASQRITHRKRLRDVADETAYLLRTAAVLGPNLPPILFHS